VWAGLATLFFGVCLKPGNGPVGKVGLHYVVLKLRGGKLFFNLNIFFYKTFIIYVVIIFIYIYIYIYFFFFWEKNLRYFMLYCKWLFNWYLMCFSLLFIMYTFNCILKTFKNNSTHHKVLVRWEVRAVIQIFKEELHTYI